MYIVIGRNLGGFHHQVIRQLTGWHPKFQSDGSWSYPPTGNGDARGGIGGCGYIRCLPPQHRRTVHSNQIYHGYVSIGRAAPWGMVVLVVIGTGQPGSGGDAGGGHRWELPVNYRDFRGVTVIYLFCRRTKRVLITLIIDFEIYILTQSLILFI